MLQPTRCRSDEPMAQILSERLPCNHLQVVHSRIARDFDEGQPAPARFVMLFPEPVSQNGQTLFGIILRRILAFNSIEGFESAGPYFGEAKPDFGFVQIDLQGLPAIELCGDSNVIEVGLEVATLGFPMGEAPLTSYDQGTASQISAFARRGILSSVPPCVCAEGDHQQRD